MVLIITQDETISGSYKVGNNVNLEVDIIARYLERMSRDMNNKVQEITESYLEEKGFS